MKKMFKVFLLIFTTLLLIATMAVWAWWNFIENPRISHYKNKSYAEIKESTYETCVFNKVDDSTMVLHEAYCECLASFVATELKDKSPRKKEFIKKYVDAEYACKEQITFVNLPVNKLKSFFYESCIESFGKKNIRYCDCHSNNVVYFIKQYNDEDIVRALLFTKITKKATELCVGYYKH